MQAYLDPERENDPHALPNIEVFYVDVQTVIRSMHMPGSCWHDVEPGWYWWPCFPGCLPDGDPVGPFETMDEALEDSQDV